MSGPNSRETRLPNPLHYILVYLGIVALVCALAACGDDPVAPYTPGKAAWPADYRPSSPNPQPERAQ